MYVVLMNSFYMPQYIQSSSAAAEQKKNNNKKIKISYHQVESALDRHLHSMLSLDSRLKERKNNKNEITQKKV